VVSPVIAIGKSRFGLIRNFQIWRQLGNSSRVPQGTKEIRLARLARLFFVVVLGGRGGLPCCGPVPTLDQSALTSSVHETTAAIKWVVKRQSQNHVLLRWCLNHA
jgi:hypothetical protein